MPSDDRVALALEALTGPASAFRSTLAATLEQVRGVLATQATSANGKVDRFEAELGHFAAHRIDAERFATVAADDDTTSAAAIDLVQRVFETLAALLAEGDGMLHLRVEEGGDLAGMVSHRLAHLGTAFGAARVLHLARSNRYRETEHSGLTDAFPFERWSRAERGMAPPLVVEVCGKDVRPAGLVEFLDGSQKMLLVVHGTCPPAVLVRLVSPRIFVLQTVDGVGLDRVMAWEGAGIAALVSDTAARFVHDPAAGPGLGHRLHVDFMPDEVPREPVAGLSAAQQAEELAQLADLSTASAPPSGALASAAVGAAGTAPVDPAEKVAAWLLRQADLDTS